MRLSTATPFPGENLKLSNMADRSRALADQHKADLSNPFRQETASHIQGKADGFLKSVERFNYATEEGNMPSAKIIHQRISEGANKAHRKGKIFIASGLAALAGTAALAHFAAPQTFTPLVSALSACAGGAGAIAVCTGVGAVAFSQHQRNLANSVVHVATAYNEKSA